MTDDVQKALEENKQLQEALSKMPAEGDDWRCPSCGKPRGSHVEGASIEELAMALAAQLTEEGHTDTAKAVALTVAEALL